MKKIFLFYLLLPAGAINISAQKNDKPFTEALMHDSCSFTTTGRNTYFILEPGFQLVLEGKDGNNNSKLVITVLDETKMVGNIETRIVEENETLNGLTIEISRNYFAFCKQTGTVYYFGEDVDMYKDGKVVGHEGSWIAEGKNKPGIAMPGLSLLGARYYQEMAPGIAMDRAETISVSEKIKTPAGDFINCLKTEESNALKPKEKEYKLYAPGIGLIRDEDMVLVKYGFAK